MSPFTRSAFRQCVAIRRGSVRRPAPGAAALPERLEPRLALAGVVGLVVTGDVLTITGDALANELWIDLVAPNQIRVGSLDKDSPTGLRDARGTVGHEPLVFSGIRDVVVRLRGGDDTLSIGVREGLVDIGRGGDPEDFRSPVTVLHSLMVDAGTGADVIQAYRLDVEGGATFLGGPGSDRIGLEQTRAFGSLSVNGGLDRDIVSLRDASGPCARRVARHRSEKQGRGPPPRRPTSRRSSPAGVPVPGPSGPTTSCFWPSSATCSACRGPTRAWPTRRRTATCSTRP